MTYLSTMPSNNSVRQRTKKGSDDLDSKPLTQCKQPLEQKIQGKASEGKQSEWDFKLALVAITAVAFATRFWAIAHPKQVVFDEVHFGKVDALTSRQYIQLVPLTPCL